LRFNRENELFPSVNAKLQYSEMVKALIDKGADVNAKDKDGQTALMLAAGGGYTEIVKALIEKGADVNAKNNTGDTALSLAKKGG
jgi:ankyrin repeat protein